MDTVSHAECSVLPYVQGHCGTECMQENVENWKQNPYWNTVSILHGIVTAPQTHMSIHGFILFIYL